LTTTQINDPLGAVVTINTSGFNRSGPSADTSAQKNITEAIKTPTILIQVSDRELIRYYFKKVNADYAFVIGVRYKQNMWKATEFIENPTEGFMVDIFQRGIRLL